MSAVNETTALPRQDTTSAAVAQQPATTSTANVGRQNTATSLSAEPHRTATSLNTDLEAGDKEQSTTALDTAAPATATTTPATNRRARPARLFSRILAWIQDTWLDTFTILSCLITAFAIYIAIPPVLNQQFPYNARITQTAWGMRHSKPQLHEYISTVESALYSFFVPAAIMALLGPILVREFSDVSAALIGLGYALATSTLFQVFIKVFIGGLRPYFLNACNLGNLPTDMNSDTETRWLTVEHHCGQGGRRLKDAQMSFPSGHASAAFAGFVFLALWFNGKFKIFGQSRRSGLSLRRRATAATTAAAPAAGRRIQHWKLILFAAPWLVATLMAACKVNDNSHHPEDVIFGALIGTAFAHMAYRMVYRSIYNWRDNHIPRERQETVDSNGNDA